MQEKKEKSMSQVAASEQDKAQPWGICVSKYDAGFGGLLASVRCGNVVESTCIESKTLVSTASASR